MHHHPKNFTTIWGITLLLVFFVPWGNPVSAGIQQTLSGTIHSIDGMPVAEADIRLYSGQETFTTTSDSKGKFTLIVEKTLDFPVRIHASAPGFETLEILIEHQDSALELILSPSGIFHKTLEITGSRADSGHTPVPSSTIDADEIKKKDWGQDLPLLLEGTPGFYAYNDNGNGMGYSYFFLRGFDMRRNSVMLNGVPLNDAASHAVYFVDLNSFAETTGEIQIQRGTGRYLYGGSAIGGSVNIETRTPLNEERLRLAMMGGSWNTRRFSVEFDTGLINREWAATFRYSKSTSDGYRDQSWLDAWNYFATIEHYGKNSTTRLILFGGPERTHLAYEGVTRAYLEGEITGNRRRDRRANPLTYPGEIDDFFQPHYQLIDTREIRPGLLVQNTLYYFEGNGFFKQYKHDRWMPEYDLEPFPGSDGSLIDTTDLVRKREVDEWDGGWIPSIEWTHAAGRGHLQAGIALRLHSSRHTGKTVWAQYYPPDLPPDHPYYDYHLEKQTVQPFIEENWKIRPGLDLLAGLSWNSHHYRMDRDKRKGMHFDRSYSSLLPRLGLNWTPRDNLSFYASISRGTREPAFRDIYDPQDYWFPEHPLDLEQEELIDYEIGATASSKNLSARLNLFLLDFDNEIVWAGGIDEDGLPVTANGARTTHHGAEVEVRYHPVSRFAARLTASYNHAVFDQFTEYDWDGNALDHSGNHIAGTPEWMGSLELNAGWGPADFMLTINSTGRFFLDNTEDNRKNPEVPAQPGYIHRINPSYTMVGLAARIDLGRSCADLAAAEKISLDLRVTNVLDTLATSFGYVWGPEPTWIPIATRSFYAGLVIDWGPGLRD